MPLDCILYTELRLKLLRAGLRWRQGGIRLLVGHLRGEIGNYFTRISALLAHQCLIANWKREGVRVTLESKMKVVTEGRCLMIDSEELL